MEIYHEVAPLLEEFSRMGLGDSKSCLRSIYIWIR